MTALTGWRLHPHEDAELGLRLRAARRRAGLTQAGVAARIGRTASAVCTWERGKRGIAYDDLIAYAIAVHAPLSDLIGSPTPAPGGAMTHNDNDNISVVPGDEVPRIVDDGTWAVYRRDETPRDRVPRTPGPGEGVEDRIAHEGEGERP